jgi:hypothetical protein
MATTSIPPSTRGWRRAAVGIYQRLVPLRFRPRNVAFQRVVQRSNGGHILGGVFKGMRYFPNETGDSWYHRLLGLYEIELADAIPRLTQETDFTRVVNVGSAEGYCAIGLALKCPKAKVVAFEMLTEKHRMVRELAEMNAVDGRVTTHGACTPAALDEAIGDDPSHCLVFIDVEGAEMDLLDPVAIPKLRQTYILMETHEGLRPGSTAAIRERFSATHDLEVIPQRDRTPKDLPFDGGWLTRWYLDNAREDRLIVQEWWIFRPKKKAQDF